MLDSSHFQRSYIFLILSSWHIRDITICVENAEISYVYASEHMLDLHLWAYANGQHLGDRMCARLTKNRHVIG